MSTRTCPAEHQQPNPASIYRPRWQAPFLEEHCSWLWLDQAVPMVRCRFDPERYRDSLYEQWQIAMPETIRNSVPKRRAEFLAGRVCAQRALHNLGLQDFSIGIGEHRNPIWPRGFTGSISHTNGEAVAVAMHQGEGSWRAMAHLPGLGIDIEEVLNSGMAASIDRLVLNPAERNLVAAMAAPRELLLTLIFSARESFFKAAFPAVGRHMDCDAVTVSKIHPELKSLELRIKRPLHRRLPAGREFEVDCQVLEANRVMTRVLVY